MKRKLLILGLFLIASLLVSCKPKEDEKKFSGAGVTITLDNSFIEEEVIQAPFYLESKNHIFMSLRESKTDLGTISTLDSYIQAVLNNNNKTATIQTYDKDDLFYKYAYYTSTVGEQTFGYMLVVMEGENHFYTMNFGCLEEKLEDYKEQYNKWIKTIEVE